MVAASYRVSKLPVFFYTTADISDRHLQTWRNAIKTNLPILHLTSEIELKLMKNIFDYDRIIAVYIIGKLCKVASFTDQSRHWHRRLKSYEWQHKNNSKHYVHCY